MTMNTPIVMLLVGPSGVGKTELARKMSEHILGRMTILEPKTIGEHLAATVDWSDLDCLAIDEVSQWDRQSVVMAIRKFEADAREKDKKLLLILQSQQELANLGIVLNSKPAVLELQGYAEVAVFSYQGRQIAWPEGFAIKLLNPAI